MTVNRSEYQAAVSEGLEQAGIPLADAPEELHYMLTVSLGSPRGFATECGRLRNVRYTLYYAVVPGARAQHTAIRPPIGPAWSAQRVSRGARAIQLAARGRDGACSSNVFDQLSSALRDQMTGTVQVIDPREQFYDEDPRFKSLNRDWTHASHDPDSDVYYANLKECMDEARIAQGPAGARYDHERFEVCMKSLGWRPVSDDAVREGGGKASP